MESPTRVHVYVEAGCTGPHLAPIQTHPSCLAPPLTNTCVCVHVHAFVPGRRKEVEGQKVEDLDQTQRCKSELSTSAAAVALAVEEVVVVEVPAV
jgi:hypothetical protein